MSDPRFAKLKTDPRFRRIRKKEAKVVVDDRFKSIFDQDDGKKKKKGKGKARVDKYGRPLADTHEQDNLRRFYRLENEEDEDTAPKPVVDYARGAVLLESSDEEEPNGQNEDEESDSGGFIALGGDASRPIPLAKEEAEIDLDEDNFADLDAQAAAYTKEHEENDATPEINRTRRLAVVNLDWDHVKAIHLYKIFSSLVSPTAASIASTSNKSNDKRKAKGPVSRVVRGKVLSVRVYPSEFGKERMAREEKEGPPVELFNGNDEDEDDKDDVVETNNGEEYNEEALRKYQLERLRYYYAIVECDSVEAASHLYDELEATELERSANVFDLSFVPDDMEFDGEFRDEATGDLNAPYNGLEFVTDALRHSRVKLTWDEDDPERTKITRRTLTRKEIDENDFKAYIASSSESEPEDDLAQSKKAKERERIRALLLSGGDDALPEGWNRGDDEGGDTDMEITFTPGLSESKGRGEGDETTLEKYQRKMKEKNKKRKEERKEKAQDKRTAGTKSKKSIDDDFFAGDEDSGDEGHDVVDEEEITSSKKTQSTAEELALIAASDNPNGEVKHFSMKAVLQAEKSKGKKRKGKKKDKNGVDEQEAQDDFTVDVQDDRFKALHEDHTFAIDPSNPHFKKTKSMSALLEERSKRQKKKQNGDKPANETSSNTDATQTNLKSLVESVKRKSAGLDGGSGKRRKL